MSFIGFNLPPSPITGSQVEGDGKELSGISNPQHLHLKVLSWKVNVKDKPDETSRPV